MIVGEAFRNGLGNLDPGMWHYRPGSPVPAYLSMVEVAQMGDGFDAATLASVAPRLYHGASRLVSIPHPETGAETPWRFEIDSDTGAILGPVGADYHCVAPSAIFDLIGQLGFRFTTAGRLGENGEILFACNPLKGFAVTRRDGDPDPIETFLQWRKGFAGLSAIHGDVSTTRTVCKNTLTAAVGSAQLSVRVPHTVQWAAMLAAAAEQVKVAVGNLPLLARTFQACERIDCSADQLASMLRDILGARTREDRAATAEVIDILGGERVQTDGERGKRAETIRTRKVEQVVDLFRTGPGNRGASWWDALNAVTDYADHYSDVRGCGEDRGAQERRRYVNALLNRTRLKQDALDYILTETPVRELVAA
ncbi:MAG: DUF932 domain-containing protein [Tepidisphaeraceae bacterium]